MSPERHDRPVDATVDPAPYGYYTVAELMARWRCGRTKAYQLIHAIDFPAPMRVGRHLRFARHEVWAYETTHDLDCAVAPSAPPAVLPPARRPGPKRRAS